MPCVEVESGRSTEPSKCILTPSWRFPGVYLGSDRGKTHREGVVELVALRRDHLSLRLRNTTNDDLAPREHSRCPSLSTLLHNDPGEHRKRLVYESTLYPVPTG
jgi:hypothetical protein